MIQKRQGSVGGALTVVDRQHEALRFEQDIETHGKRTLSLANAANSILLARAQFEPFEGTYEPSPYLMLTLCLAGAGRFRRQSEIEHIVGYLRPGTFAFALPDLPAEGHWPRVQMLGVAVDTSRVAMPDGKMLDRSALVPAANTLYRDAFITSVMTALWHDAECHGLSSAFFEHGVWSIVSRLANLGGQGTSVEPSLESKRLSRAFEFIESRLGTDMRMEELATELQQDIRTVTRAFRNATGLAPFEYLTARRVEKAKQLLIVTRMDVTTIAAKVGYANPSKFSAAFRRLVGCSPTDWRRLHARSVPS